MELKTLVLNLIEEITKELHEPDNQEKIKKDILEPFTMYVIKQMYP
jgi:hypothetical protein